MASERTRERLKAMMKGRSEAQDETSELVRLIIEEALEAEAKDALSRDYYARGAAPGMGYRRYHDARGGTAAVLSGMEYGTVSSDRLGRD